jgi:hypothetical protein
MTNIADLIRNVDLNKADEFWAGLDDESKRVILLQAIAEISVAQNMQAKLIDDISKKFVEMYDMICSMQLAQLANTPKKGDA